MQKLIFAENWRIGHKQIDEEHEELLKMINEMVDDIEEADVVKFGESLAFFCEKVAIHFDNETKIMSALGYEEQKHENMHSDLLKELELISRKVEHGDFDRTLSIVFDIFVKKILKGDIYFADYLRNINYVGS